MCCWVSADFVRAADSGVSGPLLGISPGSMGKREHGDSSAAGFGEVGWGGEDWGL